MAPYGTGERGATEKGRAVLDNGERVFPKGVSNFFQCLSNDQRAIEVNRPLVLHGSSEKNYLAAVVPFLFCPLRSHRSTLLYVLMHSRHWLYTI